MWIWKPHPGKFKEMRETVIEIRDHGRRVGGANEMNCAALSGSFQGHFAISMRCDDGIQTAKAEAGFRDDEEMMNAISKAFEIGDVIHDLKGRRLYKWGAQAPYSYHLH